MVNHNYYNYEKKTLYNILLGHAEYYENNGTYYKG